VWSSTLGGQGRSSAGDEVPVDEGARNLVVVKPVSPHHAAMSVYAYLVCTQCNVWLWLGRVIHDDREPIYYHLGADEESPNWAREGLNAVLWKMLADHARHPLTVRVEGDRGYEPTGDAVELGGSAVHDIDFAEYLKDWPGLRDRDLPVGGTRPQCGSEAQHLG
jgi:hypothetical protein